MTKIHVERKHPMFNCNRLNGFYNANVAIWDRLEESEETEVKKNVEWLKGRFAGRKIFSPSNDREIGYNKAIDEFSKYVDQLDEPEVLSQEWIDSSSVYIRSDGVVEEYVHIDDLKKLIVPKQEEVDRAYKAGYETGKEHATRDDEPETVASVMADYFGALARIKEVLAVEVEEMEK